MEGMQHGAAKESKYATFSTKESLRMPRESFGELARTESSANRKRGDKERSRWGSPDSKSQQSVGRRRETPDARPTKLPRHIEGTRRESPERREPASGRVLLNSKDDRKNFPADGGRQDCEQQRKDNPDTHEVDKRERKRKLPGENGKAESDLHRRDSHHGSEDNNGDRKEQVSRWDSSQPSGWGELRKRGVPRYQSALNENTGGGWNSAPGRGVEHNLYSADLREGNGVHRRDIHGIDITSSQGRESRSSSQWGDWGRPKSLSQSAWMDSSASTGWGVADQKSEEPSSTCLWEQTTATGWGEYLKQPCEPPASALDKKGKRCRFDDKQQSNALKMAQLNPQPKNELSCNDGSDDSDMDDDEMVSVEEKAYQDVLPKLRSIAAVSAAVTDWHSDKDDKVCLICPAQQRFKGWKALLQHAEKFKKKRAHQHRGYFRALSEILQPVTKPENDESIPRTVLIDSNIAGEVIVWPPVVIVENIEDVKQLERHIPRLAGFTIDKTVLVKSDHEEKLIVVFPASEVGHIEAGLLTESLAKPRSKRFTGRDSSLNRERGLTVSSRSWSQQVDAAITLEVDKLQLPQGYLAESSHMQDLDPSRTLVQWSCEKKWEIIKSSTKKTQEEYKETMAKVTAKLAEVDSMKENCQIFKSSKELLLNQLKDTENALNMQKLRENEIKVKHANQLKKMDQMCKKDLELLEEEGLHREERLQKQLEINQTQLENERASRVKEVEILKQQFHTLTQELEKDMARKALEKEAEIARRRETLMFELKKQEAQFNEEARLGERNLIANHERERMKLLELFEQKRQDLLMEWVEKQTALKDTAQKAKQEKESLQKEAQKKISTRGLDQESRECVVCLEDFDEMKIRSLLKPCGHATLCLNCARKLYKQKNPCPICREPIKYKPQAMPQKLYM